MRVTEDVIIAALKRGSCIKTFYRTSARLAGTPGSHIPDGYLLESPDGGGDVVLCHTAFRTVEKHLVQTDSWEQVVGVTLFGGSTWRLQP